MDATRSATVYFITHPDVVIHPTAPVSSWPLSARGLHRMRALLTLPWVAGLVAVWCSSERKARDGAMILAGALGLGCAVSAELGENDRTATGYLPPALFEAVADAFFAKPDQSVRGWERAVDAQNRIVAAVDAAVAASPTGADIAIVSHGGVGALLLCHLLQQPISRSADQPPTNGGNYFAFDRKSREVRHGWLPIDGR